MKRINKVVENTSNVILIICNVPVVLLIVPYSFFNLFLIFNIEMKHVYGSARLGVLHDSIDFFVKMQFD